MTERKPEPSSPRAVASLVFAILGIIQVAPCIGPIVAIILGNGERGSVARAGVVIGWVTLALYVCALLLGLVLVAFSAVTSAG